MPDLHRVGWLAGRVEEPIDPDEAIVDAHHHLWKRPGDIYDAHDLAVDAASGHNITHTVFVECSASYDRDASPSLAPVGETRFVADEAATLGEIGGPALGAIVGFADMTLGAAVADVLDAHVDAGDGLFRGVRHGTNWSAHPDVKNGHHDPTDALMATAHFRAGIATLAEHDLSFDAWLYFDQLGEFADLAAAVPGCRFVLDHLGGPLGVGGYGPDRPAMLDVWRTGLSAAAAQPNVVLKIGGLGMEHYFGTSWSGLPAPPSSEQVAAYWHDEVHFAIDAFGPERCMLESNYPVDRQTLPYTVLWNAFQILADPYSATERADLFVRTARRAYRIE